MPKARHKKTLVEKQADLSEETLGIILGASQWPHWPQLDFEEGARQKLIKSAKDFKQYLLQDFHIQEDKILDLFDNEHHSDELDWKISKFLETKKNIVSEKTDDTKNLLIYYVGHGYIGDHDEYLLSLRNSRDENRSISSYPFKSLVKTLEHKTRNTRCFVILDCCYAAKAVRESLGPKKEIIEKKIKNTVPRKMIPSQGLSLLCASGPDDVAKVIGREHTLFTEALLDVLKKGNSEKNDELSFDDIKEATWNIIQEDYGSEGVEPFVHTPKTKGGDIANYPLFPNPAKMKTGVYDYNYI